MTNLIIAIMSDTFGRIMTTIRESDNRILNDTIIGWEHKLIFKKQNNKKEYLFWYSYNEENNQNTTSMIDQVLSQIKPKIDDCNKFVNVATD